MKNKRERLAKEALSNSEVQKLADRIKKMRKPEQWLQIQQDIGYLVLIGKISDETAKTILYLHQSWQQAYKVKQAIEEAVAGNRDEVWVAELIKGKPLQSRMDEARKYPELWARVEDGKGKK